MQKAHQDWVMEVRDVGFLPEAEIHARAGDGAPYDYGQSDAYDLETIFGAAQLATSLNADDLPAIVKLLDHEESAVRYWGATGLLCHEKAGIEAGHDALTKALADDCGSVAIVAAEALGRFGSDADAAKALETIMAHTNQVEGNVFEAILACNALDYLDEKAISRLEDIKKLPTKPGRPAPRVDGYVRNILPKIISDLEQAK
jgi:uncharacterized sulfatase